MTIRPEFERFLDAHYTSIHTKRAYLGDIDEFLNISSGEFEFSSIEKYIKWLFERGLSTMSISRKLASLSVFFEFLKNKGVVDKNLVKFVEKPKVRKNLPKFLGIDETLALLNGVKDKRDRAMLELIYSSSLRASETVGLNVEDVDFGNLRVRIKRKGNKVMHVPISKRAAEFVRNYLSGRESGPLFLNRYGKRLSSRSLQKIVKKYALKGIFKDISPHTLRHSRATHLLNSGMDIRLLQKLLGHSSIVATQIYTHVNLSELAKTYDNTHPLAKDE